MTTRFYYISSVLLVVIFIGTAWHLSWKDVKTADAQITGRVPFAGQLSAVSFCCNGIQFSMTPQYHTVARGIFLMPWENMIPIPQIGKGLYSWWSIIPGEKVVGDARPGGICEVTSFTGCIPGTPVDFTVQQMGTTLIAL